jgi:hypothetical protein
MLEDHLKTQSRAYWLLALILPVLFGSLGSAAAAPALQGTWMGTPQVQATSLRVVFHFTLTLEGKWNGTLDNLDEGQLASSSTRSSWTAAPGLARAPSDPSCEECA